MRSSIRITCPYLVDGRNCRIAQEIGELSQPVSTSEESCRKCQSSEHPVAPNNITASLAFMAAKAIGEQEAKLVKTLVTPYIRRQHVNPITGKPESTRSLFQAATSRISSWKEANRRWEAAGKPVRSDEEVKEIIAVCEECEHYSAKVQQCRLCGCFCRKKGMARFNKPKMETESCPIGKW